jgi:hypothetical protein
VLRNAVAVAPVVTIVAGVLRSTPSASFTIDFYASPSPDSSGFGEGARWLGALTVLTNPAGIANFARVLPASTTVGEAITATATDALGNTSEFSAAEMIEAAPAQGDVAWNPALALSMANQMRASDSEISAPSNDAPPAAMPFLFDDWLAAGLDAVATALFQDHDADFENPEEGLEVDRHLLDDLLAGLLA